MTVETTTNVAVFTGNNVADTFSYSFLVLDASHLTVSRRVIATGLIDKVYTASEYTVSGVGTAEGSITLLAGALSSDYQLIVIREVPYTQTLDIVNQSGFYPNTVEEQLDKTVMGLQQIGERVSRSLVVGVGETAEALPTASERAGKFIAFNAEGDPIATSGTGTDAAFREDAASDDPLKGDALLAHSDDYADTTARIRINILSATARPAMVGIFSSASDQRAALLDFISKSAADGKTIEWGPIDVWFDGVTVDGEVRGLGVPTGSRWVMHPDTRMRVLPNASDSYAAINLRNVQDVVIEGCGAKLFGERDQHTGGTGEHGHGVRIQGSTNICIRDLHTQDFWGDGFYIGVTAEQGYCQDVLLEHISADNNRRQGLSLISARGFRCNDSSFINTNGTSPEAGIDIEPNAATDYLEDVEFSRILTAGNNNAGFKVFLAAMDGSANRINMTVDGLRDDGSNSGIQLGYSGTSLPGLIRFSRPHLSNAALSAIAARNYQATGPKVIADDPILEDWNRDGDASTSPKYGSGVAIYAESSDGGTAAMGNILINRPRYILNSGAAPKTLAIVDERAGAAGATAIEHIDPVEIPSGLAHYLVADSLKLRDREGASSTTLLDASLTINSSTIYSYYEFPANASSRAYTISNTQPIDTELEFVVGAIGVGRSRLTFGAGVALLPENSSGGFYIYSDSAGARLRIRKIASSTWTVISKVGTWSVV